MTTAERLYEEGTMRGEHEEALHIAQEMMEKGLDHEIILTLTRLSPDDLVMPSR